MKKPIVWNKENIITNGIWIIIGETYDPYKQFKAKRGTKAPKSMDHTLQFVEREKRTVKSWEDTTLTEIGEKSVYDEKFDEVIFTTHGGTFDLEHIEDCFYAAWIKPDDPVKIGVNADETMLIVKNEKLELAIMGMIV